MLAGATKLWRQPSAAKEDTIAYVGRSDYTSPQLQAMLAAGVADRGETAKLAALQRERRHMRHRLVKLEREAKAARHKALVSGVVADGRRAEDQRLMKLEDKRGAASAVMYPAQRGAAASIFGPAL